AALLVGGCIDTPDPCAGYRLACLGVTVEEGPKDTYQLLVVVEDYSSTTPLTPRDRPKMPLVYPLRFAVRFAEFDQRHRGEITLDVSALDGENEVRGSARQVVKIDNMEKQHISMSLGAPFDMAPEPDLRPPPDLAGDLSEPADLAPVLADS